MNALTLKAQRLARSIVFYPVSSVYLVSVAFIIAGRRIDVSIALVLLTCIGLLILIASLQRELRTVHLLVNSQRDELLGRIDQLITTLNTAGIAVPIARDEGRKR